MEKYRYIRKTVTWNHHRYEVRGKTEQEACDKLADLITTLKQGDLALAGSNLTVDQWFAQWRDTYKAPSGLTPKSFGLYDEKYRGYIGPAVGHLKLHRGAGPPPADHPKHPGGAVLLPRVQAAHGDAGALPPGPAVPHPPL